MRERAFDLLRIILQEDLEVEEFGGRFSSRPFTARRDTFYPEAFLGDANLGIAYIKNLWQNQGHVQELFEDERDYHFWAAQFLMIVAIVDAKDDEEGLVWPGYRLMPEASRAMESLQSRLALQGEYQQLVTNALGMDPSNLNRLWPALAARANSAELGSGFLPRGRVRFPDEL